MKRLQMYLCLQIFMLTNFYAWAIILSSILYSVGCLACASKVVLLDFSFHLPFYLSLSLKFLRTSTFFLAVCWLVVELPSHGVLYMLELARCLKIDCLVHYFLCLLSFSIFPFWDISECFANFDVSMQNLM